MMLFVFLLMRGDRSWLVGLTGTVVGIGLLTTASIYVVHIRNSMAKFREMGTPHATLKLDDSSFTIKSEMGAATLQWAAVKEVWCFEGVWLLLYSRGYFNILPLENLPTEMRSFITERVVAFGGKVS
jgi:hypothetical protein